MSNSRYINVKKFQKASRPTDRKTPQPACRKDAAGLPRRSFSDADTQEEDCHFSDFAVQSQWNCTAISVKLHGKFSEMSNRYGPTDRQERMLWQVRKGFAARRKGFTTRRKRLCGKKKRLCGKKKQKQPEALRLPAVSVNVV